MDLNGSSAGVDGSSEHHDDDDIGSTVAVHAASPRPPPVGFSTRSGAGDTTDDDYPVSDVEDVASLGQAGVPQRRKSTNAGVVSPEDRNDADDEGETTKSPAQLSLNKMNLKNFEKSAKQGNIPLRTDMLGPRHTLPTKKNTASSSMFVNSGFDEGSPLRPGANAQSPFSRRENSGSVAPADKVSVASVECEAGSIAPHREGDDLNVENLREHMRELYSGQPLPLHAENIGSTRPRRSSPRSERRDDLSVLVEPSEADAPSITSSAMLPRDLQPRPSRAVTSTANIEDLWSIASTGDHEHSILSSLSAVPGSADHTGVYQTMLNTENLVQLRQQLESGQTPLRSDMLYGFIRAMGQGAHPAGVSPSMVVEVPVEDRGAFGGSPIMRDAFFGTNRSGGSGGSGGGRGERALSDPHGTDGETDAADHGSNSPRAPERSRGGSGGAPDDEDEDDLDGAAHRDDAAEELVDGDDEDNSSGPDHNGSLLLTDGENFTEDTDVAISKDQVRDLWRAIVELKNERRTLERRFAETSRKLDTIDTHSEQRIAATQAAISAELGIAVEAIEARLSRQLQETVRTFQALLNGAPRATSTPTPTPMPTAAADGHDGVSLGSAHNAPLGTAPTAGAVDLTGLGNQSGSMATSPPTRTTVRLLMQVSPSLLQQPSKTDEAKKTPLEFIVPMEMAATVGDAKKKFVSRLEQVGVLKPTALTRAIVLRYKGRHAFDEDKLVDVIDMKAVTGEGDADAHLFVLDASPIVE